jgi:hypothetical protein
MVRQDLLWSYMSVHTILGFDLILVRKEKQGSLA